MSQIKGYMTAEEVAVRLAVSRQTVSNMVKDGRLPPPSATVGNVQLWREEEVFERKGAKE